MGKNNNATQSSLELYISAKMDAAKDAGLTYSPLIQGAGKTDIKVRKNVTENKSDVKFSEKRKFGLVKNLGTHSFSTDRINKGITPSHPVLNFTKQTLEFKTQSYVNNGLSMVNGKIQYHNPNLIKGTQSEFTFAKKIETEVKPLGKNAMAHAALYGTQSSKINSEKKFYVKPNNNTRKIESQNFLGFVAKLTDNTEIMINSDNVTVNGEVVKDPNYVLKPGDIVRVGNGHYINNSNQIAIVK